MLYWTILQVAIPGTPGVSWIGHVGGLVGGVLAAWLLRSAPPAAARRRAAPARRSRLRRATVEDLRDLKKQQGKSVRGRSG